MKRNNLTAYALDFASFIIQNTKYKDKIINIILFGSVAREEETENSDLDIFIDIIEDDKKIEKEISEIRDQFISSSKYNNYWKLFGIKNDINPMVGSLKNWKALQSSIIANGITLYGKFKPEIKEGKHNAFFAWENIKPNAKRVLFNKQIYGYKQGKKAYKGLLETYNGERLGKGSVSVPLEHSNLFIKLLRNNKINFKIKKVIEY